MAEIEVKARARDFNSIIQKLKELGCELSEPITQKDVIYLNGETDKSTRNVLRIRSSGDKHLLTLKRNRSDELDCIELETEVSDQKATEEILEMLGYKEWVRVSKARRKCKYGEYEICLDQVEELGDFIEVEKISEEPVEAVREELIQFLEILGVDLADRILKGYDTLVDEKNA